MDRLAEQVVAWHNRHPLAKRITIYDVHTIGVVALPFMRSGRGGAAGPVEPVIEPVLTDEVSPESLAAGWSEDETVVANPNAARLDALADQEEPPPAAAGWRQRLAGLLRRRGAGAHTWPAFSERFIDGLSPRRIAAFAEAHGDASRPGDDGWPQRIVPIDERMMDRQGTPGGAWPFELYLMSAAIDAGRSRSRVLIGRGPQPALIGRRCLSPWRVGLLALIVLAVAGGAALALWPHRTVHEEPAAASAASAPVTASAPQAVPASAPASAVEPAEAQASAPDTAASAASAPEATEASEKPDQPENPASEPASAAPTADIRPQLGLPGRPPRTRPAEDTPTAPAAEPPSSEKKPATEKPAERPTERPAEAAPPKPAATPTAPIRGGAEASRPVVALVGPASASKAEAEALLQRLRSAIGETQGGRALQAQVFQTPEGWRPAVWPFASREAAQLINATLVARGLRTRAVDF